MSMKKQATEPAEQQLKKALERIEVLEKALADEQAYCGAFIEVFISDAFEGNAQAKETLKKTS